MLPSTIDYILSLRDASGGVVASLNQYQVVIPNFPPLTTINYSVLPADPVQAYILYELSFGEAMVPHSFDVKIRHGSSYIINAIISERFSQPISTFAIIGHQQPALLVAASNLTLLTNYYELATFFISITSLDNYNIVVDALRRLHTSTRLEQLAAEATRLLALLPPSEPRPPIGAER